MVFAIPLSVALDFGTSSLSMYLWIMQTLSALIIISFFGCRVQDRARGKRGKERAESDLEFSALFFLVFCIFVRAAYLAFQIWCILQTQYACNAQPQQNDSKKHNAWIKRIVLAFIFHFTFAWHMILRTQVSDLSDRNARFSRFWVLLFSSLSSARQRHSWVSA